MSGFDHYFVLRVHASDHELIYRNIFTHQFDTVKTELLDREPHLTDENDPHELTGAQVGLDLIQNQGVASEYDAREATRSDAYLDLQGGHAFVRTKFSPISGVRVPVAVSPDENTTLATQRPTLTASPYSDLWGENWLYREFEIAVLGDMFQTIVWRKETPSQSVVVDVDLDTDQVYEWRCRDVPEHGLPSAWSAAGRFEIPTLTIDAPQPTLPSTSDVPLTDNVFSGGAFTASVEDTHASTTWTLFEKNGEVLSKVWESVDDTTNLTEYTLTENEFFLTPEQTYVMRVAYTGQALGVSSSGEVEFTTTAASVDVPTVTTSAVDGILAPNPTFVFSAFSSSGYADTLDRIEVIVDHPSELIPPYVLQTFTETGEQVITEPLPEPAGDGIGHEYSVVYYGVRLGASEPLVLGSFVKADELGKFYVVPKSPANALDVLTATTQLDNGSTAFAGFTLSGGEYRNKLTALDAQGNSLFNRYYRSPEATSGTPMGYRTLTTDGTNLYGVEIGPNAAHISSVNGTGNVRWAKKLTFSGTTRTIGLGVAVADNHLYVVGYAQSSSWVGFITKMTTTGNVVKTVSLNNESNNHPSSVVDVGDGIVVLSVCSGKVYWTKYDYDLTTVLYNNRLGSYFASNNNNHPASARYAAGKLHFVTRALRHHCVVDAQTGDLEDVFEVYSGTAWELVGAEVQTDGSITYALHAANTNAPRVWLAHYDPTSAVVWSKHFSVAKDADVHVLTGSPLHWDGSRLNAALAGNRTVQSYGIRFDPASAPDTPPEVTTLSFSDLAITRTELTAFSYSPGSTTLGSTLIASNNDETLTTTDLVDSTEYSF